MKKTNSTLSTKDFKRSYSAFDLINLGVANPRKWSKKKGKWVDNLRYYEFWGLKLGEQI